MATRLRWLLLLVAGPLLAQEPVEMGPLRVTVLDPAGKPVRGAMVEVLRFEGADASYSNLDIDENRECRTVSRMPTPKSGSLGVQLATAIPYRVRVDVRPYAIEWRAGIYAGEELSIQLRPGATIEGVVRDDSGRVIPAENVVLLSSMYPRALRSHTTAGVDGTFRFERVMPVKVYVDAESSQGAVHGGQERTLEPGKTTKIEFALDRGAVMRGQVVDASTGKPIAGAKLGVGWTFDKPVLTDADGRYELIGLGGPYSNNLYLCRQGYCKLQIDRPEAKSGIVQLDFQMERGFAIEGRIVDADGDPVANCYVAAVGMTLGARQETDWLSTRTDANGRYSIRDLRRQLQPVLLVRRDRHATLCLSIPKPGDRKNVVLDEVRLRPRRVLQGVLLDRDGRPVVGQKVELEGNHAGAPAQTQKKAGGGPILGSYLGERDAYTDSLGRFFFGELGPGKYRLKTDPFERAIEIREGVPIKSIELRK